MKSWILSLTLTAVAAISQSPLQAARPSAIDLDLASARYIIETVPGSGDILIDGSEAERPYKVTRRTRESRGGLRVEKIRCRGKRRPRNASGTKGGQGAYDTIRVIIPRDRPLDLNLRVHRGESEIDLGGLTLTGLEIELLSGDHDLRVGSPLQAPLDRVRARASRGDFDLSGLANIGAREFLFRGSAGDFDLAFDGAWDEKDDAVVRLKAAMGDLSVGLPGHVRLLRQSTSRAFMGDSGKDDLRRAMRVQPAGGPGVLLKMRMTMGASSLSRF